MPHLEAHSARGETRSCLERGSQLVAFKVSDSGLELGSILFHDDKLFGIPLWRDEHCCCKGRGVDGIIERFVPNTQIRRTVFRRSDVYRQKEATY